ncbi:MAG: tetratricopeptide repeat protein [Acidobacteriota bacterium]
MISSRAKSRPHQLVLGLLLLAIPSLVPLACRQPPPEGSASLTGEASTQRDRLAVLYFENSTDPEDSDRLGRMMTSLLRAELARRPDLDVVSTQRVYDAASQIGGMTIGDAERAVEIARALKLDKMLIGQVARGEALSAAVDIVDVAGGSVLTTHREQAPAGDLFTVAAALGQQISDTLQASTEAGIADSPSTTGSTASVEAYRHYVTGQDRLHRHDFAGAMEAFVQAVAIDPDFAQAHYRLSIAALWQGNGEVGRQAAEQALRLADNLPPLQQDLYAATALYQQGHYSEALPRVESLLVEDPEDKEALYLLSEMYLHSGVDAYIARATEAMLILESIDPSFGLLRNHLALALVLQDRWQEATSYLDRWIEQDPEMISLRHVALGIGGRLDEVPELQAPVTRVNENYGIALAMLQGRWQHAGELVARKEGEGYHGSWHQRTRGTYLTYRGRFDAAIEAYRGATSMHAAPDHEGIQNGFPTSAHLCLAELAELRGDMAAARQAAQDAVAMQPSLLAPRYFAGRLAARDGDIAASEEHLRVVRRLAAASHGTQAVLFEQALEAEVLLAEGRAEEARQKYESVVGSQALLHDFYASASSTGAVFRDGLARTCRALWDQSCEIAALRGLIDSDFERLEHPVLYMLALFRLGELHLEAGEITPAREYFTRFLEPWSEADWPLNEIAEAREILDRRS